MSKSKKVDKIDNPEIYNVGVYIRTGGEIKGIDVTKYQKDRVEEYCKQLKLKIKEYYIDDNILRDEEKKELNRLFADINKGKINMIITANLERIAGTQKEMVDLIEYVKKTGVKVIMSDSREELSNYKFIEKQEEMIKLCKDMTEDENMEM